jgi:hypothetical protein
MPVAWLRIPTCTPPDLEKYRNDPKGLKTYVGTVAGKAKAELLELYFDVGGDYAYALIRNLDDPIDTKAVSRIFGADYLVKVVTAEQAAEAIEREKRYRPPRRRPPTK